MTYSQVVIVARYPFAITDVSHLPLGATGLTQCGCCAFAVVLIGRETDKVSAGTWTPLCEECSAELQAEHPEVFDPGHYLGQSEDPEVH